MLMVVICILYDNNFLRIRFMGSYENKKLSLAPMEAVSPDLKKQGFLAVVFVNREYSGQRDQMLC
jgi:hypothetical protein